MDTIGSFLPNAFKNDCCAFQLYVKAHSPWPVVLIFELLQPQIPIYKVELSGFEVLDTAEPDSSSEMTCPKNMDKVFHSRSTKRTARVIHLEHRNQFASCRLNTEVTIGFWKPNPRVFSRLARQSNVENSVNIVSKKPMSNHIFFTIVIVYEITYQADPFRAIKPRTKLSLTRWSADWKSATVLYEQAANAFRVAKDYEKAKEAFEKASKGQEMISSPWDAARHMESAAALAKELGKWNEVADFYRRASELYVECGRSQPSSDALAKGARALEEAAPDEAIQLYADACSILEEDGREQMAFDLYRAAASVYIQVEKYTDAAAFLLRLGLAADKCNATNSQCKAYLSAIIVYLYAHDFKQAEKCFNDCSQIDAFLGSDQGRFSSRLLSAYREGDIEEIKRLAQSSSVSHLDNMIIKLARKLPTGDVGALKTEDPKEEEQEPLDENDLT
uniref:Gamma-soluble NSF attachment protein n=1 Tax=Cannabis sativa TaxID=3483 RepID=A0A803QDE3_CANSA